MTNFGLKRYRLGMTGSPEILEEENRAFNEKKADLLAFCSGKYAVFKGSSFLGVFDSTDHAYSAGIEAFGNVPFLIKRVQEIEPEVKFPALCLGLLYAHA